MTHICTTDLLKFQEAYCMNILKQSELPTEHLILKETPVPPCLCAELAACSDAHGPILQEWPPT